MFKVSVILILHVPEVLMANILAAFSITSVSHQIVYRSLTLELWKRGHNLTIITPNPMNDPNMKNYREIDVSFQYELWDRKMMAEPKELRLVMHFPEIFILLFSKISPEMCHSYFSSDVIRDFVEENSQFDLLISEFGINPCMYAFAKLTGYRHIGIYSFQTNPVVHSNSGNPIAASYIPDVYFPFSDRMTFTERMRTTLFQGFFWLVYVYTMASQNLIVRQHFGKDVPHLVDLERNVTAILVNSHFTMSFPRPNLPNLIEIGGPAFHLNNRKTHQLPEASESNNFQYSRSWNRLRIHAFAATFCLCATT